jgi:AraC-like DNA-binding protein
MALVRRAPHPALARHVRDYYGFREDTGAPMRRREGPGSSVVLIISFGHEWRIGDALRPSAPFERLTSFVGGLRASSVLSEHAGRSEGMQVNLAPLAAHALFRVPMHELSGAVVPVDALLGQNANALVERLHNASSWDERFALVETALGTRLEDAAPTRGVEWAWRRIFETQGRVRIGALCDELGWSRRRLAATFREEIGLAPKVVARLVRLERAVELAQSGRAWAQVAYLSGYYDQSHLVNEFREITGTTPAAFVSPSSAA